MEVEKEEEEFQSCFPIPNPMLWFSKIIILQADILHDCFLVLVSPFFFLYSLLPEAIHRAADERKDEVESAERKEEEAESEVHVAARAPPKVAQGSIILLRKVFLGFLGAAHVCVVLLVLWVVAVILGVGVVQIWSEEPVLMKDRLYFDYTEVHPTAVFAFDGDEGFECRRHLSHFQKHHQGVPVGHTFYVSLAFLMPESDYNREIGVFQVTAELISSNGNIMAKSSQPCMLRFRSWPIRMVRTSLMALPLLLGFTDETQSIKLEALMHEEGFPRTGAIRISLVPRSGTNFLPQLYEAEMVLKSQLPWGKELVRRWKWTFYVWASLYAFVMLVIVLLCCGKPLIFPVNARTVNGEKLTGKRESEEGSGAEEMGLSEKLRRWRERRSSRKAMMLRRDHTESPEALGSSATSMSLTRENTGTTWEDEDDDDDSTWDSESGCCKGGVDVD